MQTDIATWLACCRMGNRPRTKIGEKWPAAILWGGPKWPKHGRANGRTAKFGDCLFSHHLPGHFSGHFGTTLSASHFSPAISRQFWSWAGSHSVAGQPSRKTDINKRLHPPSTPVLKTPVCNGGNLLFLQLELCCLQLSFFAYSPLRPLLEALSHCKQKTPTVSETLKL